MSFAGLGPDFARETVEVGQGFIGCGVDMVRTVDRRHDQNVQEDETQLVGARRNLHVLYELYPLGGGSGDGYPIGRCVEQALASVLVALMVAVTDALEANVLDLDPDLRRRSTIRAK
jgi:hypothetical protein